MNQNSINGESTKSVSGKEVIGLIKHHLLLTFSNDLDNESDMDFVKPTSKI